MHPHAGYFTNLRITPTCLHSPFITCKGSELIWPPAPFLLLLPGLFFFFFVSRCFFSFQLGCRRDSWVGFDWFSFKKWGLLDCSREGGPAYWFRQWILRSVRGRFSWWLIAVERIWWLKAVGFGNYSWILNFFHSKLNQVKLFLNILFNC